MSSDAPLNQDVLSTQRLPCYRVHFLNSDNTIFRAVPLEAFDDNEASKLARRLMNGRALDLWDGLRFIEFFPRIVPPA